MKVTLPRDRVIDLNNIPPNFEELIRQDFAEFTEGTSKDYTYQDKLYYIDLMAERLHQAQNRDQKVYRLIKDRFEYNLDELNIFTDESEFLSLDFMGECYELGRKNATLYDKYIANDYHDSEKIMELEVRAIKAIINYEKVEEHSNDKVLQD